MKELYNWSSLNSNNVFDFQAIIYSVPLCSFKSNVLNVGWYTNTIFKKVYFLKIFLPNVIKELLQLSEQEAASRTLSYNHLTKTP